jgi:hypothetical protein
VVGVRGHVVVAALLVRRGQVAGLGDLLVLLGYRCLLAGFGLFAALLTGELLLLLWLAILVLAGFLLGGLFFARLLVDLLGLLLYDC